MLIAVTLLSHSITIYKAGKKVASESAFKQVQKSWKKDM